MVRIVAVAAAIVLAACSNDDSITQPLDADPVFAADQVDGSQDRYIVVFRGDVADPDQLTDQLTFGTGAQVQYRYRSAIKGFAGTIPPAAVQGIQRNPNVILVEPDGIVTTTTTQNNATWGLDRIDQRNLPLNSTYTYDANGSGVSVYIIDTGIRYTHNEFGGRASFGYDAFGGDGSDCHGHGTHVAGTVGGTVYGVAKNVNLYAVRVLNCSGSGSTSGVIAGVDWVRANASKPAVERRCRGRFCRAVAGRARPRRRRGPRTRWPAPQRSLGAPRRQGHAGRPVLHRRTESAACRPDLGASARALK
jgi:subtilisin family serine protease